MGLEVSAGSTKLSINKALSKTNKVSKLAQSVEKGGHHSSRGRCLVKTRNDQAPIENKSETGSESSSEEDESTSEYSESTLNHPSRLKTAIVGGSEMKVTQ